MARLGRGPTPLRNRFLCATVLAIALFALSGTAAFASTWNAGDIFVGVASGKYKVYSNSGTFKETINAGTRYTAGCAFNNAQSKLFTTYVSNGNVETFATAHVCPLCRRHHHAGGGGLRQERECVRQHWQQR